MIVLKTAGSLLKIWETVGSLFSILIEDILMGYDCILCGHVGKKIWYESIMYLSWLRLIGFALRPTLL